ncbi:MAG: adenylosuccinate lyase [Verrucomicrobia bacterium 61-8]|nr:adenylosuccinate lyase [Verrucomicrobiota bacterium]OJV26113.1 MAG: adenylosuccinate lyase [Verrucomicrobia bacterium 61-8]
MIDRYSLPEMRSLWTEQRKLEIWLEIETLACEAMADLGEIPKEDAVTIRSKATFNIEKVREIEKRTNHDVIAFLEEVATHVGPAARWVHQGLTSSDLLDTTLAVQMNSACEILEKDLISLREAIAKRAIEHKFTPMIGRSHGIHAEPITFGLKMALMYDEFGRSIDRLREMRERVRVGKISGAVGTHAHLDPRVEKHVCEKLGLKASPLSTQIIQRDRHAEFMTVLALIASSIDRWATEFRHLQRTEVLEVEEYFAAGQKGSSAMPHKRNPITGERLSGLARVIRGNAMTALENVALWHERDISHSSAERIILPDSCTLMDYMLVLLRKLVDGLQVYPENMRRNMDITRGLYASQSALLMLTARGLERKDAYEAVQRAAMKTWKEGGNFADNLAQEPTVSQHLGPEEIAHACAPERHFRFVEDKFRAVGIEG